MTDWLKTCARRAIGPLGFGLAAVLSHTPAMAQATGAHPVLQAEQNDVATLPPIGPHWFIPSATDYTYQIFDMDKGRMLGTLPASMLANIAISPDHKVIYVADTMYSRVDHGTRQDLLQVYDAKTLALTKEIELPPRALAVYKKQDLDVSSDGRWAYIFDMSPATAVTLVDLSKGAVARTVDIPGCALIFPWKSGGFSSLCGDGSLTNVGVNDGSQPTITHTKPFFDANNDPVFEQGLVDHKSGKALFISYTGKVYNVTLGQNPTIDATWSLQKAAGLPQAGTGVQELAWRPGGQQPFAWNTATGHLFVLMHSGNHWTHKTAGTELWEFDPAQQVLLRRIDLPSPAKGVAVSPDKASLVYVTGDHDGPITVIDAATGQVSRTVEARVGGMSIVPDM
ncbi:amine dehydrogenase [Acetobacter sacchari]|uniref:Amine dehydrogenase n=1 Tax=Acetobacter sacchari TaxID=2661687 RepID=A0ABS3LRA6_9PROT|nr:amine dehydrogenase large subunit [Acetobacter sacchari]MBO1358436.1 amine dehydrogenase [Acetobacter sacchari]